MKHPFLRSAGLDEALKMGLSESEYQHLTEIFGRKLTVLELGLAGALYSEHCSYKSTKLHLKSLPSEGEKVLIGPGENAGVISIGDGEAVVFKVESHNHPSFIEPYHGAATGVGGILRDIFTMGARPLALMNSLRFGAEQHPKTRYLLSRAVRGIGTYGNCMGIPTVGGELFFHESYEGNCLVNAFALGLVDQDKIFLGSASGVGNLLIYAGSPTGRDGIHGAVMASDVFADDTEKKRPSVQIGDPFIEKLLLEACLEVMHRKLVVGIQDMGAAGLTCASFEMADRARLGVRLNLDRVPLRENDLTPYEIMLSESQERMLLVVKPEDEAEVLAIFKKGEIEAVTVGEVIDGDEVELLWHNEKVAAIKASLLTCSVPLHRWPEEKPADFEARLNLEVESLPEPADLGATWLKIVGSVNCCSRSPLYQQYDSTVRSNTVVHPGGDAAVIRIKRDRRKSRSRIEKGIAMTLDCNSRFCGVDPHQGTALSVAEAYRNISAVGATPIGISDCLNFGSPQRPEGMWQIASSIRGLGEAARAFNVPIVSGNVSLYNETASSQSSRSMRAVLPTPTIAMVGFMSDAAKAVAIFFRQSGHRILVLGETRDKDLGASEYLAVVHDVERGALPVLDYDKEILHAAVVRELIEKRLIVSCHDLSSGGLAVALVESCLSGPASLGAVIEATNGVVSKSGFLFSETGGRYLISFESSKEKQVRNLINRAKIQTSAEGVVGGEEITVRECASIAVAQARVGWSGALEGMFEKPLENSKEVANG